MSGDPEMDAAIAEAVARVERKRARAELAKGWAKCCRCFPGCVSDAGFCSCCGFDNATGKTDPAWNDPDPFEVAGE